MSCSTTCTALIWPSGSGSEPSTTCSSRSAAATSSSVDRKASTSWCGRCRTNPTVSVSVYSRPSGPSARRTVGSRVANSAFSTSTPAPVSWLSRLDLPAFVYPAIATLGVALRSRLLRWVARAVAMPAISRRSLLTRVADAPPVGLDLGLTGATGTDTATAGHPTTGLPGQRLTPAAQSRQHVLHLRQLDLGLALPAGRVLGEDVQDQRGPVDDLDLEHLLQLVELARGQLTVADHGVGAGRGDDVADLGGLARADVGGGVRLVAALAHGLEDLGAGGLGQGGELGERAVGVDLRPLGPHADEDHALEAQLPVLDLGDVGQLGAEPGHAAQRATGLEVVGAGALVRGAGGGGLVDPGLGVVEDGAVLGGGHRLQRGTVCGR